jgi:hypothetical protein
LGGKKTAMKIPEFVSSKIAGLIYETSRLEREVTGHADENITRLCAELSALGYVLITLRAEMESADDQELPEDVETTLLAPACILAFVEKIIANPDHSGLSAYGWQTKTIDLLVSLIEIVRWEIEMLPGMFELYV